MTSFHQGYQGQAGGPVMNGLGPVLEHNNPGANGQVPSYASPFGATMAPQRAPTHPDRLGDPRFADQLARFRPYFGEPAKPYGPQPYAVENYDLPDAYSGKNPYLSQVIVREIREDERFPLTEILPWNKMENAMSIQWDEWKFNDHTLDHVPHEGVSRLVMSEKSQHSASLTRWGKSLLLEHGFMDTEQGRQCYAMNIMQIANAVVETAAHGAIMALFAALPYADSWNERYAVELSSQQLDELFAEEINTWAIAQKTEYGVEMLLGRLKERMVQRGVTDANYFLAPAGMLTQAAFRDERKYNFLSGDRGGPHMPDTQGLRIRESRAFLTGNGNVPHDPCFRNVSIGEFFLAGYMQVRGPAKRSRGRATAKEGRAFDTSDQDIIIYSEDVDDYVHLDFGELVENTGLYDADWRITPLGRQFFSSLRSATDRTMAGPFQNWNEWLEAYDGSVVKRTILDQGDVTTFVAALMNRKVSYAPAAAGADDDDEAKDDTTGGAGSASTSPSRAGSPIPVQTGDSADPRATQTSGAARIRGQLVEVVAKTRIKAMPTMAQCEVANRVVARALRDNAVIKEALGKFEPLVPGWSDRFIAAAVHRTTRSEPALVGTLALAVTPAANEEKLPFVVPHVPELASLAHLTGTIESMVSGFLKRSKAARNEVHEHVTAAREATTNLVEFSTLDKGNTDTLTKAVSDAPSLERVASVIKTAVDDAEAIRKAELRDAIKKAASTTDAKTMLDEALMGASVHDGRFVQLCLENNIPCPLGVLLLRPHQTYRMGTGCLLVPGGKTGYTFMGHADFELGDNVVQKMIYGNFTMYAKSLVLANRNLLWARNIYCARALGGAGDKFWKYHGSEDGRDAYMSGEMRASIICCAVPMNYTVPNRWHLDITGAYSQQLYAPLRMEPLHHPGAEVYAAYWGWKAGATNHFLQNAPYEDNAPPTANTICFQGHQFVMDPQSRKLTRPIVNRGHWGERVYPGCRRVRNGQQAQFDLPDYLGVRKAVLQV